MKKRRGIPYAFGAAMLLLVGYTTGALAQEQLYAYPNAGRGDRKRKVEIQVARGGAR